MSDKPDWEPVAGTWPDDYLERIRISGGWLYRTTVVTESVGDNDPTLGIATAMVFVPDPSGRGLT
jgi:hypothetical protein